MLYARVNELDKPLELFERDYVDPSLVRKHANGLPVVRPATSADKKWIADNGGDAPDLTAPLGIVVEDKDATPYPPPLVFKPAMSAVFRKLLDRIRALEGKPALTDEQYAAWEADSVSTISSAR